MKHTTALAILILALLFSGAAFAHHHDGEHQAQQPNPVEQTDDDRAFNDFLRAIDVLWNRPQLEARWPDAMDRLIQAAEDTTADTFVRRRALSILGQFHEDPSRDALLGLTADEKERVRALAFYTLGRHFLNRDADRVFAHLEASFRAESLDVQADIVRALGFTADPRARALLQDVLDNRDEEVLQREAALSLERSHR